MTDLDDAFREATEKVLARERSTLRLLFAPKLADALERYLTDALVIGFVREPTRRVLVDLLAEHGLADPDGRAPITSIGAATGDHEIQAAHAVTGLSRHMTLAEFRKEYHRRRRESVRPLSAREVANQLCHEAVSAPSSGALVLVRGRVKVMGRLIRHRRSH